MKVLRIDFHDNARLPNASITINATPGHSNQPRGPSAYHNRLRRDRMTLPKVHQAPSNNRTHQHRSTNSHPNQSTNTEEDWGEIQLKVQVAKRPRTPNFSGGDSICGMKYAPKAKRPEDPNFNSTLACRTLRHHRHAWTGSCSQLRYRQRNFSSTTI